MYFTTVFAGILSALTVVCAHAESINARAPAVEPHVIFFDDFNLAGAAYSPDLLIPGVCSTLPGDWLDRAESVIIGPGYSCTFFIITGCEGTGIAHTGTINLLEAPLYNGVESFLCTKLI